ncbi:MAG: hypothetical protein IPJ13_00955 [Saprospiraceae bacterium]|nr:hypothetical protein [Saprospiraceae bacterium]
MAGEYLPWEVTVDEISLQNNQFRFDDNTKPSISPGMDYAHLDLTKFNVEMDRFFKGFARSLKHLSFPKMQIKRV